MENIVTKIRDCGIIPVVKIDRVEDAVPLAGALKAGGINAAEITFRTACAEDAIKAITRAHPDMLVGAGTVTTPAMAETALKAGASFIVSPGFDDAVVDYCLAEGVQIFPGVATATELTHAVAKGLSCLKFFPAEQAGGIPMLNALSGPFASVHFMPTGGISESNLANYVKLKNVIACGGSWMIKSDLIEKGDWQAITALCKNAVTVLHGFTFAHAGFNAGNEKEAANIADSLALFGFPALPGNSSIFNGTVFETMKKPGRGSHGHIGIKTWNVDRALAYFERHGFKVIPETILYTGEAGKSPIKFAYLDKEIAGFAFHLIRA
jgi:2-dehydro-3-deoxyphosphogluconate aldolase/(4S)-4-hydroxy-2-oxoglutarate aldolase